MGKMYAQAGTPGHLATAWQNHEFALQFPTNSRFTHYNVACYYCLCNRPNDAFKHLTIAMEKGFRDFTWLRLDPDLELIRNHPELKKLVEKYSETLWK
jgi:hypothetical protein